MEQGRPGRRRHGAKVLRNQSTEVASLIIFEYLYDRGLQGEPPPTVHYIQQHATKLRTSQFARVQENLAFLEQRGWLERIETTGGTSFRVSAAGKDWWAKVGKQALTAFSFLYPQLSVNQ